jgi:macrophage erythroblast attacher
MAEFHSVKLNPESHFLLDQPLLRLPYELSRNNFRTAHRQIEQSQTKVQELIQAGVKHASSSSGDGGGDDNSNDNSSSSVASLDQAITRLQTLKRKMTTLSDAQTSLVQQAGARIRHVDELYHIPTLADVAYDEWSRVRLNRLLVDYLLRQGYTKSARDLAAEKNIEALVDVDEFEAVGKIVKSLREERRVDLALVWCGENKVNLKKINVSLDGRLCGLGIICANGSTERYGIRTTTATVYRAYSERGGRSDHGSNDACSKVPHWSGNNPRLGNQICRLSCF